MDLRTRINLFILAGSHSINSVYNRFLTPILPLIAESFGVSIAVTGLLSSVYSAGNGLFQIPISFLADYTGRRRTVIVFSLLLNSIPVIFIGYADTYVFLLTLVFLSGVGSSAYHPATVAMVAEQAPGRRGMAMGLFKAGGDFGSVFTPAIVAWLTVALSNNWRSAAQWCVLPGVIGAALIAFRFRDNPAASRGPVGQAVKWTYLDLLRNPAIRYILLLSSCRVMCLRGIMILIPFLLKDVFGFATGWVGGFLTIYFLFGTGSSIVLGRLSDRFRHTIFIVGMMVFSSVSLLLLPMAGSVWTFFPLLLLLGINLSPSQGPILAVTTEIAGEKNHASAVGVLYSINEISAVASPFIGGLVAQLVGLQRAFFFFAAIALLGVASSLMVHRVRERQRANDAEAI